MLDPSHTSAQPRRRLSIWSYISMALVFGFFAFFIGAFILNWIEVRKQANVAMALSDLRTYETALRTYKIDHYVYPQWRTVTPPLTTPVQYLRSLVEDVFAKPTRDNPAAWLRFASDGRYYIAWSVGPDKESQISGLADIKAGLDKLQLKSYDSSNGTLSAGDLWRSNLGQDESLEPQPIPNVPCP